MSTDGAALSLPAALKGRSLWDDARRRLLRNRTAVIAAIVLALLAAPARGGTQTSSLLTWS